jgi:hypothetical protein
VGDAITGGSRVKRALVVIRLPEAERRSQWVRPLPGGNNRAPRRFRLVAYPGLSARLPLSTRAETKEKRTSTDFRPLSRPKFRETGSGSDGRTAISACSPPASTT